MQISLVILAAGLGTRFKKGIKQTAQVGPNGEMILEYSIHDALQAGFDQIIFVIRKDMEENFKNMISKVYHDNLNIQYVFQEIDDIPISVNYKREKPWGTAHALYSLRENVVNPFAVINADDYYGKDAFIKMYKFLKEECDSNNYALVGYPLNNTLSANGSVNRGICQVERSKLISIEENFNIHFEDNILLSDQNVSISENSICSMGFYGFSPTIFVDLKDMFEQFLENSSDTEEFMIPFFVEKKIESGCNVKVLNSLDKWVGITYNEDLEKAKKYFFELHKTGVYPNKF